MYHCCLLPRASLKQPSYQARAGVNPLDSRELLAPPNRGVNNSSDLLTKIVLDVQAPFPWLGLFSAVSFALTAQSATSPRRVVIAHLGTVEPGNLADLVLLDANPPEHIAKTRRT